MRKHIEYEFESGNNQIYWDDVVMFLHFKDYQLRIWKMQKEDVIEIDGFDELVSIDSSYGKDKSFNIEKWEE